MSAPTVGVTALLLDVLDRLDGCEDLTASEGALVDLLWHHKPDLQRIRTLATAEMQALAPAVLATADAIATKILAHSASQPAPDRGPEPKEEGHVEEQATPDRLCCRPGRLWPARR